MSVSHSGFHQKIINKYQKGQRSPFGFPMMIFHKHAGYRILRRSLIHMSLQFRFHNVQPAFIVKDAQRMERFLLWFRPEKVTSARTIHEILTLIHRERISSFSPTATQKSSNRVALAQAVFSKTENMLLTVANAIQRVFSRGYGGFFYSHAAPDTGFSRNRRLSDDADYIQVLQRRIGRIRRPGLLIRNISRYVSTQENNVRGNYLVLGQKTPAVLPQIHELLSERLTHEGFQQSGNRTMMNYYQNRSGAGAVTFRGGQRDPLFDSGSERFYFRKQQTIDQEMEEIKKVVIETQQAVAEGSRVSYPSVETEIKKHLDIHRLSDQVYQNLEQRIRIERERRGL